MKWSARASRTRIDEIGRAADDSLRHAFELARDIWNGTDADLRRASDLYARMADQVLEVARASLKGTPSDLVAHGQYEIALHPSTLDDHGAVLDVYRGELVRLLTTWRDDMRARARTEFTVPPTIEFVEDPALAPGEARASSSSGGVCILHRSRPSEEVSSFAGARPLRVRWGSDDAPSADYEFAMRRAPYVLGRDQDEPRCRVSESLRTGREQAVLLGIPETGEWWIVDGRLDGSPATNPTRVDGVPLPPGIRRKLVPGMVVGFPDQAAGGWQILES